MQQKRNAVVQARTTLDHATIAPRNLFNKATVTANTAIASNGSAYVANGFYLTDFIEVNGGLPSISNAGSSNGQVVYYDESFLVINSGVTYGITAGAPFIPPAGAFWMKRSINTAAYNPSGVYVYNAAFATGSVGFTGALVAGDTLTIGGNVITFVTGTPTGAQVQIGSFTAATTTNLNTYINANAATLLLTSIVSPTAPNNLLLTSSGVGPSPHFSQRAFVMV